MQFLRRWTRQLARWLYPAGPVRYRISIRAGSCLPENQQLDVLAVLRCLDQDAPLARRIQSAGLLDLKIGRGPFPAWEADAGLIADLADTHGYFLADGEVKYQVRGADGWIRPADLTKDATVCRAIVEGTVKP